MYKYAKTNTKVFGVRVDYTRADWARTDCARTDCAKADLIVVWGTMKRKLQEKKVS